MQDTSRRQSEINKAKARKIRVEKGKDLTIPDLTFEEGRVPVAWGYGRVSSFRQYGKDDSVPAQKVRAEYYFKCHLEPEGVVFGEFLDDGKGVSASRIPFHERPAGREILRRIKPGDHIIFDKVDRMWRRVSDFCRMTEWFERNHITMHIVNMGGMSMNTSSQIGKIILTLLASFAEAEAAMTAQRIRDAAASLRSDGEPASAKPIFGTRYVKRSNGKKVIEWDLDARSAMDEVVRLRDDEYYTFDEIACHMENLKRKNLELPQLSKLLLKKFLTRSEGTRWVRPYWIEKGLRHLQITEINQLVSRNDLITVAKANHHVSQREWMEIRKERLAGRKSMIESTLAHN